MRGALIETEARRLRNEAKREATIENAKKIALKMLKKGKLTVEEIAEYSELNITEIEQLKTELQTV